MSGDGVRTERKGQAQHTDFITLRSHKPRRRLQPLLLYPRTLLRNIIARPQLHVRFLEVVLDSARPLAHIFPWTMVQADKQRVDGGATSGVGVAEARNDRDSIVRACYCGEHLGAPGVVEVDLVVLVGEGGEVRAGGGDVEG